MPLFFYFYIIILGYECLSDISYLLSTRILLVAVSFSFYRELLYTFYTFIYNMSMDYKYILKQEGITIKEFANKLHVSRPTLYKLMDRYSKGVGLGEPYESIFNAFFLKERNSMKGNYQSRNGNLVVKILNNTAENANGTFIKGSETRGKRDIVMAQVLIGDCNVPENTIIYFSYYAGQPFTLEGEELFIVNKLDIKFIKKGEQL